LAARAAAADFGCEAQKCPKFYLFHLPLADKPEPWVFTAYRVFGALLNLLMWLLLLGVVACLMFMLLWLGGAVAVNAAITQGTRYVDACEARRHVAAFFNTANFLS
jgi:hypothetical protein